MLKCKANHAPNPTVASTSHFATPASARPVSQLASVTT